MMEYHCIEYVPSHINRTCSLAIAPCRGRQGDLRASSTQRCLRDPCPSWRRHCLHAQASPYPLPNKFPVILSWHFFICTDSVRGRETDDRYIACDLSHKDRMCSLSSARCTVLATRHHGSDETAINSHHHQVPSVSVPPVTPSQHGVLAARHHHSCIECVLSHKDRMCCLSSALCARYAASLKEQ